MTGAARRQRALFVLNSTGFGGLEIVLLDWLAGCDHEKMEILVACGNPEFSRRLEAMGIPARVIPIEFPFKLPVWTALKRWVKLFRDTRPDRIIFLEASPPPDFGVQAVAPAVWFTGGRTYFFQSLAPEPFANKSSKRHLGILPGLGIYWRKIGWWLRLRNRITARTLTASQAVGNKMVDYFGYPADAFTVAYHGVDTEAFAPSPEARRRWREENNIPQDATVLVSHGRLAAVKQPQRLLRAFDAAAREREDVYLVLTAYGELTEEITAAAKAIHGADRVRLVGFQRDRAALLQAADIYVLASDNEGFPIAVLEAMSTGLLCTASNVAGPNEIITDGANGLLMEPNMDSAIAGVLRAVRLAPAEHRRLASAARQSILDRCEIHASVRNSLGMFGVAAR